MNSVGETPTGATETVALPKKSLMIKAQPPGHLDLLIIRARPAEWPFPPVVSTHNAVTQIRA
jgi:hypothetical protein